MSFRQLTSTHEDLGENVCSSLSDRAVFIMHAHMCRHIAMGICAVSVRHEDRRSERKKQSRGWLGAWNKVFAGTIP